MLKIGDRIINRPRKDDKLPNGYGKGTIVKANVRDTHYLIRWDEAYGDPVRVPGSSKPTDVFQSWAIKEVIELDIQELRSNKLNEILKP
jgi:hypothetical protein